MFLVWPARKRMSLTSKKPTGKPIRWKMLSVANKTDDEVICLDLAMAERITLFTCSENRSTAVPMLFAPLPPH